MRESLIVAVALLLSACGGGEGTSLTGPSNSIPNVAGSYSGTTTMTFPELSQSMTCTTSTSVTQSGSTISVAPLVLGGQCGNVSVPVGQVTIDNTGAWLGSAVTTYNDPSCGLYSVVGSGGFFGRQMRLSINATSRTCYNVNMTITLSH